MSSKDRDMLKRGELLYRWYTKLRMQQKAKDVELRVLPGESGVHRCIHDIQRGRGGLVSIKPKVIRNS